MWYPGFSFGIHIHRRYLGVEYNGDPIKTLRHFCALQQPWPSDLTERFAGRSLGKGGWSIGESKLYLIISTLRNPFAVCLQKILSFNHQEDGLSNGPVHGIIETPQ